MAKPDIPFVEFPKIARLSREVIITEKIDGTNAQVFIPDIPTGGPFHDEWEIFAGSRTKWISTSDDNHGFAKWVETHYDELLSLGPGHHFGEWWGLGIQRGYGLKEKRFSLFNTSRWGPGGKDETKRPACCHVVPVLWQGNFEDLLNIPTDELCGDVPRSRLELVLDGLHGQGSVAAPGFMRPEGVVVFHTAANICFKKTLEKDDQPKGASR